MRSRSLFLLAAFALPLLAHAAISPGDAEAQVRVAVVPFAGSGGSGARRQVQSALEGDSRVSTVDLDRVDGAAERVGAGSDGDEGIAEVARELEARLIIQGSVSGRGRRRRIQVVARDANGQRIASAGGAMRGNGVARAVRSVLDQALEGLPPAPEEEPEEAPEPVVGEDVGEDAGGDTGGGEPAEAPSLAGRPPLLSVQPALVVRTRDATVTFGDASSRSWNSRPVYAELGARLELRPLASDPGLLRGLYGNFFFAHSVGLTSTPSDCTPGMPAGEDCKRDTNFFRLNFAVGFLFPLIDVLDLGIELGAGWDVYNLEMNPTLSNAEYVYVRPAIRARIRLAQELVGLDAEIGFRPVVSRGEIGYGLGGDTFGFDVGGGVSGSIPLSGIVGLTYAVQLAWVGYWLGYPAGGAALEPRSATDQGVRILFAVGLGIW